MMRDNGAFLGKAGGHLLFAFEKGFRDKEREISVDVAGVLEHAVESALHSFPNRIAVRLDDHAATHIGVFRHAGILDDIEIPLRVIDAAFGDGLGHAWVLQMGLQISRFAYAVGVAAKRMTFAG